jgi:hypothetical protein
MRFRTETITDIPADQVGFAIAEEQNSDPKPTRVEATPDGKGTFTITAYFPVDDPDPGTGSGGTAGGGTTGGGATAAGGGASAAGGGAAGRGTTSGGGGHALGHVISADVVAAAQASQTKWGVPASVTIAQWALESGWGQHMPAGSNNPFGIKARPGEPFVTASTREVVGGQSITVDQNFRKYDSIADAFEAHARLLATSPAYAASRAFFADLSAYVSAMSTVYATAPNYGSSLLTLIQADNLTQYDVKPAAGAAVASGGAGRILAIASDASQLQRCQKIAAKKLLDFDGEIYPSDGCAITLSIIFQQAGVALADTYMAIDVGPALKKLGWTEIAVGEQRTGDVGSTCGDAAQHGVDHVYIVVRAINSDEMIVADNQQQEPHSRWASGKGRSPTRFFLRAPS